MGLGIGLGSFVNGFAKGVGLAGDIEERRQRQKRFDREEAEAAELAGDRETARARLAKADARTDVLNARDDTAYARTEGDRADLEGIETEGKATFNAGVEAGTYKPEDFDNFWTKYVLPKKQAELVSQGDIEGAKKLMEWGQSKAALEGGQLFASAMWKAQTGDAAGALEDAIKAGNVGGYIAHGYEVAGQEEIKDKAGNTLGFRLTIKGPDGKELVQDIQSGDVGRVVSTFLNPDAAYASQVAAAGKAAEDAAQADTEVSTYRRKKEVDAEFDGLGGGGTGTPKQRTDAIEALRKRMDGGDTGDDPKFDDLKPAEQEKLISDEIGLQTGNRASVVPGPQKVVDTLTGSVVTPSAPPTKTPRGVSTPAAQEPAPIGLTGNVSSMPSNGQAAPRPITPAPAPAPQERLLPDAGRDALLGEVSTMPATTEEYSAQVARLKAAGVSPKNWPPGMQIWTPERGQLIGAISQRLAAGAPQGEFGAMAEELQNAGVPPEVWPQGLSVLKSGLARPIAIGLGG